MDMDVDARVSGVARLPFSSGGSGGRAINPNQRISN